MCAGFVRLRRIIVLNEFRLVSKRASLNSDSFLCEQVLGVFE